MRLVLLYWEFDIRTSSRKVDTKQNEKTIPTNKSSGSRTDFVSVVPVRM